MRAGAHRALHGGGATVGADEPTVALLAQNAVNQAERVSPGTEVTPVAGLRGLWDCAAVPAAQS